MSNLYLAIWYNHLTYLRTSLKGDNTQLFILPSSKILHLDWTCMRHSSSGGCSTYLFKSTIISCYVGSRLSAALFAFLFLCFSISSIVYSGSIILSNLWVSCACLFYEHPVLIIAFLFFEMLTWYISRILSIQLRWLPWPLRDMSPWMKRI